MSSSTRPIDRSRSTTHAAARRSGNGQWRPMRGSTSRSRCARAWRISRTTSTPTRTNVRKTVDGSAKKPKKSRLRTPRRPSSVEFVSTLRTASPDSRLATDEPPWASSPSPFETRRSISAASAGPVRDQQPARLPSRTSGRPGSRRWSRGGSRPGDADVCDGQQHVPARDAVRSAAHPAGEVRRVPGPDREPQQRLGQPVHLHDDDARAGPRRAPAGPRRASSRTTDR